MAAPLRIFHVEDDDKDAVLIERILRRRWPGLTYRNAKDRKAFQEAMNDGGFDVVLLDYHLPDISPENVVDALKTSHFSGPVIIVSGIIEMTQATALIRAGAYDFVEKSNLDRLAPAIERGLEHAVANDQRDIADNRRQETENRLRTIFEAEQDALVVAGSDNIIKEFNPAAERLFGISAAEAVGNSVPELLIPPSLRERHMAAMNNYKSNNSPSGSPRTLETEALTAEGKLVPVEVLISSTIEASERIFIASVRDISERVEAAKALAKSNRSIRQSLLSTIDVLTRTIEQRDPYTAGHQRRVADLSVAIAKELGLGDEDVLGIQMGALIHDIGKIHIPGEILTRPGRFSEAEFNLMKTHTTAGYDIIKGVELPWPIADMAYQHHEHLDGSGYPQGLKGDEIGLGARIIAVADIVEAITAHRPYRPALGLDRALEEIRKFRGSKLDPDCVDACLKLFTEMDFQLSATTFDKSS